MNKARQSASKEVTSLKQFLSNVLKPTETYILGLFDDKQHPFYELFSDFASQFAEDVRLFHSFDPRSELLPSLKQDVKVPSVLVYYHDLAVPKKEAKFKIFDEVINLNRFVIIDFQSITYIT